MQIWPRKYVLSEEEWYTSNSSRWEQQTSPDRSHATDIPPFDRSFTAGKKKKKINNYIKGEKMYLHGYGLYGYTEYD